MISFLAHYREPLVTGDGSDVEGDVPPTGLDRDGNDTASSQFYEYVACPLNLLLDRASTHAHSGHRCVIGACSFVLRIMGDQKAIDFTDVAPREVGRYVAAAAFQNVLCMR